MAAGAQGKIAFLTRPPAIPQESKTGAFPGARHGLNWFWHRRRLGPLTRRVAYVCCMDYLEQRRRGALLPR